MNKGDKQFEDIYQAAIFLAAGVEKNLSFLPMQDIEDIVTKLRGLNKLGIEVMLDDFGTGYSSLYYLQKLPANMMKIDRSFVQSIYSNSGHEATIRTIIAMADSLGMGIVAEGVEHEEQLMYLREQGCAFIQGFLFSKPVPFEELPGLLTKGFPALSIS